MAYLFIELYNCSAAWMAEDRETRTTFVGGVSQALVDLRALGVEVLAYGVNDLETDARAPFQFYCVYRVPSLEVQKILESAVRASGWYHYFDQINCRGVIDTPANVLQSLISA